MPTHDWKHYVEDPEPQDETTPEYKHELFETFRVMRATPEEIEDDPEFAQRYAEWLNSHPFDAVDEEED